MELEIHGQEIHERRVEDFGAGGEEGESEVVGMGSGQPGGRWVTASESGQVLRAAAEARRRVSMEGAERIREKQYSTSSYFI